ncbi:hypothetical protein [Chitinophaga parva]|nr:hypothetical protein [Chitinophaga parva]
MKLVHSLKHLLDPLKNCETIVVHVCEALKVPFTLNFVRKVLNEHPYSDSMLAVSEVLNALGIATTGLVVKQEQLGQLPAPFIMLQRVENRDLFVLVIANDKGKVSYIHPTTHRKRTVPASVFWVGTNGATLLIETADKPQAVAAATSHIPLPGRSLALFLGMGLLSTALLVDVFVMYRGGRHNLAFGIYVVLYAMGAFICSLLLLHQIDGDNPTLEQLCAYGTKMNCASVLH